MPKPKAQVRSSQKRFLSFPVMGAMAIVDDAGSTDGVEERSSTACSDERGVGVCCTNNDK